MVIKQFFRKNLETSYDYVNIEDREITNCYIKTISPSVNSYNGSSFTTIRSPSRYIINSSEGYEGGHISWIENINQIPGENYFGFTSYEFAFTDSG
ncbi:MAG: hypothetical protein ACTSUV_06310 [Candidatus Ranarchaeia archaeon]